jgi:hypothetical protein
MVCDDCHDKPVPARHAALVAAGGFFRAFRMGRIKGRRSKVSLRSSCCSRKSRFAFTVPPARLTFLLSSTPEFKVMNLYDSGPGSLREALKAEGPRVVVFEVSGYIEIDSPLVIKHPYVTVASHSAPWPGIVIRGAYPLSLISDDVLTVTNGRGAKRRWSFTWTL